MTGAFFGGFGTDMWTDAGMRSRLEHHRDRMHYHRSSKESILAKSDADVGAFDDVAIEYHSLWIGYHHRKVEELRMTGV